ncbi:MAG: AMP-binding protein [bacterium]|nr:AMP-binding protein [bacterium]
MSARATSFDWAAARADLAIPLDGQHNIGWHCADRVCLLGKAQHPALIWQDFHGDERTFTFDQLRTGSNTMAALLARLGVQPGDRVALIMDRVPECYVAFLAVLKLGAIVQPLFSAFGDDALRVRLDDAHTAVVITQRKYLLKMRRVASAVASLRHTIITDAVATDALRSSEMAFAALTAPQVDAFAAYAATPATPSVLHYTSGTTGAPKGVLHLHHSLLSQYLTTKLVLDLRADDVYWCTADPGWVTGTSYGIIGPWSMGVTQCVLDCGFSARAWYAFIARHRVSVWYTAPTAIRSLMSAGDDLPHAFDLTCLRHLASVGEPLNAEAVLWGQRVLGLPFHDTYWQTETPAQSWSPTCPPTPLNQARWAPRCRGWTPSSWISQRTSRRPRQRRSGCLPSAPDGRP